MSPKLAADKRLSALEAKLLGKLQKTSVDYGLLAPGDKIMVCLSGGKDSHGLLHLLRLARRRLPFSIELVAVHLDQRQPGYDGRALAAYLAGLDTPHEILAEDTYSVVKAHVPEGATTCSLCSRLRRGILYTAAERLGANKLALGHHRNDTIETFLLNLFHAGKLQAMPARYTTDDGRFEVIRPLVECDEADLAALAEERGFPIVPCNLCGSQPSQREEMGRLLDRLEAEHPHVRAVILNALKNVRPSHLLDRELGELWAARPAELRPNPPGTDRRHFAAAPVEDLLAPPPPRAGHPRLAVLGPAPGDEQRSSG